jgi:hypothetical protein
MLVKQKVVPLGCTAEVHGKTIEPRTRDWPTAA